MTLIKIKKGTKREQLRRKMRQVKTNKKKLDAKKYSGTINLDTPPLQYQKKMRNEWE